MVGKRELMVFFFEVIFMFLLVKIYCFRKGFLVLVVCWIVVIG